MKVAEALGRSFVAHETKPEGTRMKYPCVDCAANRDLELCNALLECAAPFVHYVEIIKDPN